MDDHTTRISAPGPRLPIYGGERPQELLDAMVEAALQEMKWRANELAGLPVSPQTEYQLATIPHTVMPRYRDMLTTYWVACYVDPITHDGIVALVTNEHYLESIEAAKALGEDDPERWHLLHGLQQYRQVGLL